MDQNVLIILCVYLTQADQIDSDYRMKKQMMEDTISKQMKTLWS